MGCSLCQKEGEKLAIAGPCSACGSLPEDRAFARFFRQYSQLALGAKVLDVAPPRPQLVHLPAFLDGIKYTAIANVKLPGAEALKPPHRFLEMDITRYSFSDASFDAIICNNVLPYVRSDFLAMSEVHRCLKATGIAFLNVNMHSGKSTRSGEGNGRPGTGQEWSYGEDYFERLEAAGLFVQKVEVAGTQQVVCFKFRDAMEAFLTRLGTVA